MTHTLQQHMLLEHHIDQSLVQPTVCSFYVCGRVAEAGH